MAKPRSQSPLPRRSSQSAGAPRASAAPLTDEPHVRAVSPADLAPRADSYPTFGWGGNGHQAADYSPARGYVYFPELDTRREITSYARTEIVRKARYLYANVGFARRLTNGVARMVVGTGLMPRPMTTDRAWNKLALARLEARWGSKNAYDLAGKYNGYSAQRAKMRCRYKDGDCATVLTRGADGRASTAIYESHQIATGSNLPTEALKSIFDGIRVDRHNRPIGIHLLGDDGRSVEIPARSCLLLADYERPGQQRCLPILAHAVNHLLDKTEIDTHIKTGIKHAQRTAYYIARQAGTTPSVPRPGAAGRRETVTTSAGDKLKLERVFLGSGGEVQELNPGEELKMLLDQRPHPNNVEFLEYLIRDASLGIDLSPEVLWSVVKLGGANMRFVMADAQSFIEQEQQTLVDSDLGLEYVYFLADQIAAGRLPKCSDPEWWKHDWIPPARWTVDYGRDGKLHLEQLRSGALTFRRFFGWQGLGLEELDEWLDEYAYIRRGAEERGLDPASVLALIYGRPSITTPTPTADLDDPAGKTTPADDDEP